MKVEALNCPNCGAGVIDGSVNCDHCQSRLKTMSCSSCLGTIFEGSKFCALCGEKAVSSDLLHAKTGACPRCKSDLTAIEVEGIRLDECERCEGVWVDVDTFEAICVSKESQSAVLKKLDEILKHAEAEIKVQYVPCPVCDQLMNRSNFARVSGVIIDSCKEHGVWFDAEELPSIISFIRKGGMEYSREKERASLRDERERLKAEKFKASVDRFKHESRSPFPQSKTNMAIRDFIDFIIG